MTHILGKHPARYFPTNCPSLRQARQEGEVIGTKVLVDSCHTRTSG